MNSVPGIAIVDDDDLIRAGTSSLIRSLGLGVETFASAEAFLACDVRAFCCVISDVQMPGMSGMDLQNALKDRSGAPPIILMTAFPDERAKTSALNRGAYAFLDKPFDSDALVAIVEAAVAGKRSS